MEITDPADISGIEIRHGFDSHFDGSRSHRVQHLPAHPRARHSPAAP
jgi:hypothetical protein